jgi:hypothetical protein
MDSIESIVSRIDERTHRMDERDARIEKKMDAHCSQLGDHEKRIGDLEGFKSSIYIVSAVLVTLGGLAIAVAGVM